MRQKMTSPTIKTLDKKISGMKEAMKKMATKSGLNNLRIMTKADLESKGSELRKDMVTKDDIARIGVVLGRHEQRLDRIEATMSTKGDIQVVLNHLDAIVHKIDVFEKKALVHDQRLNELEPKVESLGRRLEKLDVAS